jgi:hypothetical protein
LGGTPARFAGRQLGRLLAHPGHFTLLAAASESFACSLPWCSRRIRRRPMTKRTVYHVAAEAAGIEFPVHPHMLRHRCGASLKSGNTMRISRFHLSNIIIRITTLAKFCPLRLGNKNDTRVSFVSCDSDCGELVGARGILQSPSN